MQLVPGNPVHSDQSLDWKPSRRSQGDCCPMRNLLFPLACGVMLIVGMAGPAVAQDNTAQQPSARQELQHVHTPQSIDQELAHLTKDLELTPEQQRQGP